MYQNLLIPGKLYRITSRLSYDLYLLGDRDKDGRDETGKTVLICSGDVIMFVGKVENRAYSRSRIKVMHKKGVGHLLTKHDIDFWLIENGTETLVRYEGEIDRACEKLKITKDEYIKFVRNGRMMYSFTEGPWILRDDHPFAKFFTSLK
jgi:hypothetical protein